LGLARFTALLFRCYFRRRQTPSNIPASIPCFTLPNTGGYWCIECSPRKLEDISFLHRIGDSVLLDRNIFEKEMTSSHKSTSCRSSNSVAASPWLKYYLKEWMAASTITSSQFLGSLDHYRYKIIMSSTGAGDEHLPTPLSSFFWSPFQEILVKSHWAIVSMSNSLRR
jgi:hypothetical protein